MVVTQWTSSQKYKSRSFNGKDYSPNILGVYFCQCMSLSLESTKQLSTADINIDRENKCVEFRDYFEK